MLNNDGKLFYARFCDDMILLHPEENKCNVIFTVYQKSLADEKVVSHTPELLKKYCSDFWKVKSKSQYKWGPCRGEQEHVQSVPWLSFVGYQIRYDNLTRIRKTSIEKELKKQVAETDQLIKVLKLANKLKIDRKAIVFRLQQRLISMAVGRMQHGTSKLSMCWSAGFKVAKDQSNLKVQFT